MAFGSSVTGCGTSCASSFEGASTSSWGLSERLLSSSQMPPAVDTSARVTVTSPMSKLSPMSVFTTLRDLPFGYTASVSPTGLPIGRPMLLKNRIPRLRIL